MCSRLDAAVHPNRDNTVECPCSVRVLLVVVMQDTTVWFLCGMKKIRKWKSNIWMRLERHLCMFSCAFRWQNTAWRSCVAEHSALQLFFAAKECQKSTKEKDQMLMNNKTLANQIECQSASVNARSNADKAEMHMPVTVNAFTVVTGEDC